MAKEVDREEIPLRMIRGNLKALLEHTIPVETISLKWDEDSAEGVILVVTQTPEQSAESFKLGFRTTKTLDR